MQFNISMYICYGKKLNTCWYYIVSLMYLIGEIYALIITLLIALIAKILLETVNYIEHYGLVRKERTKLYPRHSWNSNHMISGILLYNLTRHSDHHEKS